MTSKQIEDLACDFWECVGLEHPFPRNLEHTGRCAKPIDVAKLQGLCPQAILRWLQQRGYRFPLPGEQRRLNGCLLVFLGMGFIFVDASLAAEDVRMIVAHELAHYLAEYDGPRERARRRLGPALLAVFDGERSATPVEKLEATLAGVQLGTHVHFMERRSDSTYPEPVGQVERTANDLALELIAPWRAVAATLRTQGPLPTQSRPWVEVLQERFGLPTSWARPYADRLTAMARNRRAFSETLGL